MNLKAFIMQKNKDGLHEVGTLGRSNISKIKCFIFFSLFFICGTIKCGFFSSVFKSTAVFTKSSMFCFLVKSF